MPTLSMSRSSIVVYMVEYRSRSADMQARDDVSNSGKITLLVQSMLLIQLLLVLAIAIVFPAYIEY